MDGQRDRGLLIECGERADSEHEAGHDHGPSERVNSDQGNKSRWAFVIDAAHVPSAETRPSSRKSHSPDLRF